MGEKGEVKEGGDKSDDFLTCCKDVKSHMTDFLKICVSVSFDVFQHPIIF